MSVASATEALASERDDAEWLERIRQGDREALHQLYRKHYPSLLRFTVRVTGHLELAQETINDVMLVVWRDAHTFEGRSKVATWIFGIAYRMSLKRLEQARRWQSRYAAEDFDAALERLPAGEELTEQAELEDMLAHALGALSAEQRAVVELTYYFGYSYEEIARILSCPENTVKTRMFHARAKLRALLPRLGKDERS